MTMDTRATDAEAEDQQLPPESDDGQQSSGQEEASPPSQQPTERERELERRLTLQGRELAATKRTADALNSRLTELSTSISRLNENQTAQAREAAERREREMEAYLASLPADERLAKRVEILTDELKALKAGARTDAQPARAAEPPQQREDPDVAYMRQRIEGIVKRAEDRFGVTITREELGRLPEIAWSDEDEFHDAVYELASKKKAKPPASEQNGDDVARGKEKAPEDEEARITRAVRAAMGVASPASPRAAAARGKAPTAEEVHETVSTYNSALGPKANIKALKEQRARMGT